MLTNLSKISSIGKITIISIAIILVAKGNFLAKDYYRKSDRETDWYVNYSRLYDYGQLIRILSKPTDKLMVLPVEQLIYWQSGLPHATRFLYGYLLGDPKYKKELYDYWDKTPPEFLYDESNGVLFTKYINNYIRVRKGNYDTPLFVKKDVAKNLQDWQFKEMGRLNFYISK